MVLDLDKLPTGRSAEIVEAEQDHLGEGTGVKSHFLFELPQRQISSASPALAATCRLARTLVSGASVQITDVVVPDHDWMADTVSDLGAGRYEFIVDTGLDALSAALTGLAVPAAHSHLGACDWSVGVIALLGCGLLVFLMGARTEYGENDSEGWVSTPPWSMLWVRR